MKILFLSYSQSGQANDIVQSFAKGFEGDTCVFEQIKPVQPFPFPWTTFQFFNAFPETFAQQKIELQPFSQPTTNDYDLIEYIRKTYQSYLENPAAYRLEPLKGN